MATHPARTLVVSIDRDWRDVYDFASVPQNFSRWAAGLSKQFEKSGDELIAEDPKGRTIRIRFSPQNDFGVLDHVVFDAGGAEIRVPMRVIANGTGAEVLFTVFRTPATTDEAFAADAAAVERDLHTLKTLLQR